MNTPSEDNSEGDIRVLSIDDNPVFRAAIRRFFDRNDGVTLLDSVADAQAAAALPDDPPPHVILLDLHLADHLSLNLIQALRQKWPASKVIILTFDDRPYYREAALRAGADDFVSKLSLASDLLPAIVQAIQTRPSGGERDDASDEQG